MEGPYPELHSGHWVDVGGQFRSSVALYPEKMSMAPIEQNARRATDPVWKFEKYKDFLSANGFAISVLASEAHSVDTTWNVCVNSIITKRNYT